MARPISHAKQRRALTLKVEPVDHAKLVELASMHDTTLTELARRVLLAGLQSYPRYLAQSGHVLVPDERGVTLTIRARGAEQAALVHSICSIWEANV